jgi:hypothetical protein
MTKNVKMLLGVALVGGVGYYFWKKSQTPAAANFANYAKDECICHLMSDTVNGQTVYLCGDGENMAPKSQKPCKGKKRAQN